MRALSFRHKIYGLLGGLILFFVLGYQFSFSSSFEIFTKNQKNTERLEWLKERQKELPLLRLKMKKLEKIFASSDSVSARGKLTQYISDFAEHHDCTVTEIPIHTVFKTGKLKINMNEFTVRGNFFTLINLLNKLESECSYTSKIVAARFYSVSDSRYKKKALFLKLYMQSLAQNVE